MKLFRATLWKSFTVTVLQKLFFTSCPITFFRSGLEDLGTFKVESYLMKCKQIREAIDTASRHILYGDSVTSHLNGCADCRRYTDETASLLTLLSAQPRVQAPADFDFRLRARIARAQAEQVSPASLIERIREKLLAQTFSWGQAATAMAAVVMVVAVSTLYINRDNGASVTTNDVAVANKANDPPQSGMASSLEIKVPGVEHVRATAVKFTGRSVKFKDEATANSISPNDIVSLDKSSRVYSSETRQFVPDRNLFGAEAASVNSAKSAPMALTF